MVGPVYFNGIDIRKRYNTHLANNAYNAFLGAPEMKSYVENESRSQDGTSVLVSKPRVKKRSVTFELIIKGNTKAEFLHNYNSILSILTSGWVEISIPDLGYTYKMVYENSTKIGQFNLLSGKLAVKMSEPNPKNRVFIGTPYASSEMDGLRMVKHAKITSLDKGFSLEDNTPFSIMLVRKASSVDVALVPCKLLLDKHSSVCPFKVGQWSDALILQLSTNPSLLKEYDVYYAPMATQE